MGDSQFTRLPLMVKGMNWHVLTECPSCGGGRYTGRYLCVCVHVESTTCGEACSVVDTEYDAGMTDAQIEAEILEFRRRVEGR